MQEERDTSIAIWWSRNTPKVTWRHRNQFLTSMENALTFLIKTPNTVVRHHTLRSTTYTLDDFNSATASRAFQQSHGSCEHHLSPVWFGLPPRKHPKPAPRNISVPSPFRITSCPVLHRNPTASQFVAVTSPPIPICTAGWPSVERNFLHWILLANV